MHSCSAPRFLSQSPAATPRGAHSGLIHALLRWLAHPPACLPAGLQLDPANEQMKQGLQDAKAAAASAAGGPAGPMGGLFTQPEVLSRLATNPQVRRAAGTAHVHGSPLPAARDAAHRQPLPAPCQRLALRLAPSPTGRLTTPTPHFNPNPNPSHPPHLFGPRPRHALPPQTRAFLGQPDFMQMLQDINRSPGACQPAPGAAPLVVRHLLGRSNSVLGPGCWPGRMPGVVPQHAGFFCCCGPTVVCVYSCASAQAPPLPASRSHPADSMQKYLADERFQLALQVGLGMSLREEAPEAAAAAGEAPAANRSAEPAAAAAAAGAEPMQQDAAQPPAAEPEPEPERSEEEWELLNK